MLRESRRWQIVGYLGFLSLFTGELLIASTQQINLECWQIALLGFAAFRGGVSISEDEVFCWLRNPFTITSKDLTGAGDSVSTRYESGLLSAIGGCLSCPICCATHVGSMLLTIYSLIPRFGILLIYALAIAGVAELLHSSREFLFWGGRHSREQCK